MQILYYGTLVTLVTPSCYPSLKVPNYLLNATGGGGGGVRGRKIIFCQLADHVLPGLTLAHHP